MVLDLAGLDVAKVTVDGGRRRSTPRAATGWWSRWRDQIGRQALFRMVVKYAGAPKPLIDKHHGDAGWEELADGVIVAGQPHGAPTWFPCNDRPDDKASYSISVTTAADYTVVANGELVDKKRGSSSLTWRYEQVEPMATYLATVQIGRYQLRTFDDASVPMVAVGPGRTSTTASRPRSAGSPR